LLYIYYFSPSKSSIEIGHDLDI